MIGFLLLFLHITTIFAVIVLSFGLALALLIAERSGQVAPVRAAALARQRTGPLVPLGFATAGIFGLLTAISFGYDLLAPWLVIAYLLFVVAMGTGLFVHQPWGIRLGKMLATTPDGLTPGPLATLLAEPRERAAGLVDILLVVAFLFDMVVKPFS